MPFFWGGKSLFIHLVVVFYRCVPTADSTPAANTPLFSPPTRKHLDALELLPTPLLLESTPGRGGNYPKVSM